MKIKDEIIEEIWDIKDSLAEESGGDLQKLFDIIKKEAATVDNPNSKKNKKSA